MKTILKLEELALFLLGVFAFAQLPYAWWWFLLFILTPDISMLGYLFGNRVGAFTYNLFHHRGLAVLTYILSFALQMPEIELAGTILFSHTALDRIFGYGMKYTRGFKHTHLGEIK